MGKQIKLEGADGFRASAYSAEPDGPVRGGVVVIQEIFGVNAHIREVADGYARAGYLAIAPALFDRVERGVELGYDAAGMEAGIALARGKLDIADAMTDLAAAIEEASKAGKVGVVGYCFGGIVGLARRLSPRGRRSRVKLLRRWCAGADRTAAEVSGDPAFRRARRAHSNGSGGDVRGSASRKRGARI